MYFWPEIGTGIGITLSLLDRSLPLQSVVPRDLSGFWAIKKCRDRDRELGKKHCALMCLRSRTIAGKPVNMLQALHAEMDERSIEAAQKNRGVGPEPARAFAAGLL
jgi:hypothetical protein